MENVGMFEFSRKDLIGHGAFAVVFKGRHRENKEHPVAVKCITKKKFPEKRAQDLLRKEIHILRQLEHENIVSLLDFQETANSLYLVMEYCCGGDLAEYLQSKGKLSEDTIRVFLQQIAAAMKVLHSKGIIHRDLKPQNILLTNSPGCMSHSIHTCVKIADFGFARYLQGNTMAETLCGSPLYMAPEVILAQSYDAKADLWSIGTILFQCLTGKAPFQADSPRDLRLLYEKNKTLRLNIPSETSQDLRHLLIGLLQRYQKDRMDFEEFFSHPFLAASSSVKSTTTTTIACLSSCAGFCSSSTTSRVPSSPLSLAETCTRALTAASRVTADHFSKDLPEGGGSSKTSSSCNTDDFVMVSSASEPAGESGAVTGSLTDSSYLMTSADVSDQDTTAPPPSSTLGVNPPTVRPRQSDQANGVVDNRTCSRSVAIPVPTQVENYRRIEQNLLSRRDGSSRSQHSGRPSLTGQRAPPPAPPALQRRQTAPRPTEQGTRPNGAPGPSDGAIGGARRKVRKQVSVPAVTPSAGSMAVVPFRSHPRLSELIMRNSLPAILGSPCRTFPSFVFPTPATPRPFFPSHPSQRAFGFDLPSCNTALVEFRNMSLEERRLSYMVRPLPLHLIQNEESRSFARSTRSSSLSEMLLLAAFGNPGQASNENVASEEVTDEPGACGGEECSASRTEVLLTEGTEDTSSQKTDSATGALASPLSSISSLSSTLVDSRLSTASRRNKVSNIILSSMVTFDPPELPEETLMEPEHNEAAQHLRFTLALASCLMEVADARSARKGLHQQENEVTDQISKLSREWSNAEQLVLYMKTTELLSNALQTAMAQTKEGKLHPSTSVKKVLRKLNEIYKICVGTCRALNTALESFFAKKHNLMNQSSSIKAERLLYNHVVQMVQSAALDEMFHQGETSPIRYQKALLLLEGLTTMITAPDDLANIEKCKESIERRLLTLQSESRT